MTIASTVRLVRTTPEAQGIRSSAILAFAKAVEDQDLGLHSMMLLRHGEVVAEGWWHPYGPDNPHILFSLSKSFCSTAVGLAATEGLLSLDDTVLSFFPDEQPATISDNLKAMQVRHLLSMSTGNEVDTTEYLAGGPDGNWVRNFLARPVERTPGTYFVYNSGATYMLSAIVQKVTGLTVLDYLTPRLFEPLGVVGAFWESSPQGINVGGWGLNIKTEDIACFGQLYLQKGIWQGKQLLPEAWIEEATAKHVDNTHSGVLDWAQGYGYQFWRCQHSAYRGDGAFGQFCVVMADQEAVLAITSGTPTMQAILDAVWEHLLPAMGEESLPEDQDAHQRLADKLDSLTLPTQSGTETSTRAARISGQIYTAEPNEQQITTIQVDIQETGAILHISDDNGDHMIVCGYGVWMWGSTRIEGPGRRPGPPGEGIPLRRVAASGAWTDDATYTAQLCYYETPFIRTLTLRFDGDTVTLGSRINVGFGPTEREDVVGHKTGR